MPEPLRPHSADRLTQVFQLVEKYGPSLSKIAAELGMTVGQVAGIKRRHRTPWDNAVAVAQRNSGDPMGWQEEVVQRKEGDLLDIRSSSRRIKTVEDLLAHVEADLENYDVVFVEATANEQPSKHPETGEVTLTQYHRVWVKLKLKTGVDFMKVAEQMLESALKTRELPAVHTLPKSLSDVWQVVPIADPHFGKYSWQGTTGYGDYDLEIARHHVKDAGVELINWGDTTHKPGRRTLAFLGDVFHYDTPGGTTTGGTPLERDGRMPKMVDVGTDTIMELIEFSASKAPTDVLFVRGNHDEALTTFLQKTVREVFKHHANVVVDASHTHRKYLFHQGNLLGFTHGDKAKKRLPSLMPHEAKQWWPNATYYEWHTGHTHAMKAEWSRPIETIDGVLVRVAPAICPPDDWHADHGFVGALTAMESFFYRPGGGIIGMQVSTPHWLVG